MVTTSITPDILDQLHDALSKIDQQKFPIIKGWIRNNVFGGWIPNDMIEIHIVVNREVDYIGENGDLMRELLPHLNGDAHRLTTFANVYSKRQAPKMEEEDILVYPKVDLAKLEE